MKPSRSGKPPSLKGTINVKWRADLAYAGPYPVSSKRFYQLETLHNALERYVHQKERFLWAGLQDLTNGAGIATLFFNLVYEDALRLTYAVTITTLQRKRVYARLVVAKNHEECSTVLKKECSTLCMLAERCPEGVVRPVQEGVVFLPDRHKRKDINREVFAYLYQAPEELTPLYIASSTQFGPHGPKPLRYPQKDTEILKMSVVEIIAKSYDTHTRTGIDAGDLAPESFAVLRPDRTTYSLFLVQCPKLRNRMTPGRLLQRLVFGVLHTGKTVFPMAPVRPEELFSALSKAVTAEVAREWCIDLVTHCGGQRSPAGISKDVSLPGADYLDVLVEVSQG